MKLLKLQILVIVIGLFIMDYISAKGKNVLTINGTQFEMNGKSFEFTGISFINALFLTRSLTKTVKQE
jgi:uncharacterized membrane protein (Fun14 family)